VPPPPPGGSLSFEAPGRDDVTEGIDRGQAVPSRERDDKIGMGGGRKVGRHDQGAARHAREDLDGTLDVGGTFDTGGYKLQGQCSCSGLGRTKVVLVGSDSAAGGAAVSLGES
jgi:hypothetical protein